jgi:hypothetical protein
LRARLWFRYREPINWLIAIALFAPLVYLLQISHSMWTADGIAMLIAFGAYLLLLRKRSIAIRCTNPQCKKYIETHTPWVCGYNGCTNKRAYDFPFIHRCQHCEAEPKAYKCHHCGDLIFLAKDEQKFNYATCLGFWENMMPQVDEHAVQMSEQEKAIQIAKLKVERAKLDVNLKSYSETLDPPKPKMRSADEDLEAFMRDLLGDEDAARKWEAKIREEFKGDPGEMERRLLALRKWTINRTR